MNLSLVTLNKLFRACNDLFDPQIHLQQWRSRLMRSQQFLCCRLCRMSGRCLESKVRDMKDRRLVYIFPHIEQLLAVWFSAVCSAFHERYFMLVYLYIRGSRQLSVFSTHIRYFMLVYLYIRGSSNCLSFLHTYEAKAFANLFSPIRQQTQLFTNTRLRYLSTFSCMR